MKTLILASVTILCLCGCGKPSGAGDSAGPSAMDNRIAELSRQKDIAEQRTAAEVATSRRWRNGMYVAIGAAVLLFFVGAALGAASKEDYHADQTDRPKWE